MFKHLLSYCQTVCEEDVVSDVISKLLEIQKREDFVEPFERYMRKYKLNGYGEKK